MKKYLNAKLVAASSLALDMLQEGIKSRKEGNIEKAREYFAIVWGFHSFQEYDKGIRMADSLLLSCNVNENDVNRFHDYGRNMVNFAFSLAEAVDKQLRNSRVEEFNPPFDFPEEVYW